MLYQLAHVTYRHILDIPEMTIPEESVTCIYGESGAGKSTLLRLLNMLISPDTGTVFFQGEDISQMDPIALRRRAVMLPQEPLVFPGNIRENLLLGLHFSGRTPAADDELITALETASLNKELDADASTLSGGEKQRLALARVLLLDPEVLLLDEPSASLDDQTEQTVIDNACSYAKQKKKAIVLVSHGKHIVEQYGEYAIELSSGRINRRTGGGNQ